MCGGLNAHEYERLKKTTLCMWLCPTCLQPNFSDSFFEDISLTRHYNPYDSLDSLSTTDENHEDNAIDVPTENNIQRNVQRNSKERSIKILTVNC